MSSDVRLFGSAVYLAIPDTLETFAKEYVKAKKDAGRFAGQGPWDLKYPSTYDLLQDREIAP
jgi:hypothetical protein